MKKKLFFLTFILSLFMIFNLKVSAASYTIYTANSKCNVRIGPGTNYSIIKNGNDNVSVYANQDLTYISLKSGKVNGSNGEWYGVKFDYAAREYTGYVWSNCVTATKASYGDDSAFESKIASFPESYKPYLRKLHALHNNWNFVSDNTNLSWQSSVFSESEKGTSAVSRLYPSMFYRDSTNPNGIVIDGNSWYAACQDAVAYYMDPRNFLNQKGIFMFEKLSYDSSNDSSVSNILKNSFMEGTFTENGVTKTYANAFIEAGKNQNVSSTYLAALSLQEMGTTKSSAASGTVAGYEGYYNFYNIGATSGTDNYLKGLAYAKAKGWNSIQKSITGGASFIASNYISKGQDTIYYKKYNTSGKRQRNAYTNQYQTNIMAPTSEASTIYSSYKANNRLGNSYTFVIPVYNYMPGEAFKLSKTDTVGGNTTTTTTKSVVTTTKAQNNITTTTKRVSASDKINYAGYRINGSYLTGLSYGKDVSSIKNSLVSKGANVNILNSSNKSKGSGVISTGDKINVDGSVYEAVIYGDISGDGKITIKDLLFLQRYLLNSYNLSGANKKAADISKDNSITIKDLLFLQKNLLGYTNIIQ